jgi:hypothetical protein
MTAATTIRLDAATTTTGRRRWWRRAHDVVASPPTDIEFTWANRRPGTDGFAQWAAAAGQRIADHGLGSSTRDLNNLIGIARRAGVAPVVVVVLDDPTEPDTARMRAFAAVVSALVNS